MRKRCLACYQELPTGADDFHQKCCLTFFGTFPQPLLDYRSEQMEQLAREIVLRSVAVTGVQPKLSLSIEPQAGNTGRSRFTIVGLWGEYILKPPVKEFPNLPENEDVTMHLAGSFGIETAKHTLMRLKSGEFAYITRRFDRRNGEKLALEDMCQLTETLTADKYRGSMEKVGKHIHKYASRPGLDALNFFELTLFSFLTGNADMHLKNFSLLTVPVGEIVLTVLSPAYDLLCTKLAIPEDTEEMALTLNAKKRKLRRADFDALAENLGLPKRSVERTFAKFSKKLPNARELLRISFLPKELKTEYQSIMDERAKRLGL